ncbi:hypothetical protein PCANC_04510 [Puccinia coronata f. sp. avenae]|uniref:Uncharacterized protein n=1 Tax=Puccinia coronata f. sp. avenae TaxID=200324 RepID=A0A2N5TAQ8_9BASI|nr:hypothetical protein PCASD_14009 [Puccinia coronata f. sp. avenae]PLW41765.1 hypothetical protein PCASD_05672 [Puccinia coronata f. sp. avenae]PLW54215.1 hypothetical protein PCANC_04510 [Puccinia coronata f. sp. avenae]
MGKGSATGVAQLDGQLGHSWSNSMATPVHRPGHRVVWPSAVIKVHQLGDRRQVAPAWLSHQELDGRLGHHELDDQLGHQAGQTQLSQGLFSQLTNTQAGGWYSLVTEPAIKLTEISNLKRKQSFSYGGTS